MGTPAVTLFFALLAVASLATVLSAAALALAVRRSPAAARLAERMTDELRGQATALAAVVATVATAGSLYLSEVANFPPCSLCWVQRGFMYPLAAVLAVAAWRGWHGVRPLARVWALLGATVSLWHVALERFPALETATVCDPSNPCSLRWVEHFGFMTIPVMALAAFLLVATLLSVPSRVPDDTPADDAAVSR